MLERDERLPELLLATTNPGKLVDITAFLRSVGLRFRPSRAAWQEAEETGATFAENALLKAGLAARSSGVVALADDSGIEVDALGGEPGVRSRRWAGEQATDADRVDLLLERLRDVPPERRGARFVCVAAVCWPDGQARTFSGACEGVVAFERAGTGGFGYDPVFYIPALGRTMAQLDQRQRAQYSHRGKAIAAAGQWLHTRL